MNLYKRDNVQLFEIDLDKSSSVNEFCDGANIIIGAIGPSTKYSEKMLKIALEMKIPYIDPGGMYLKNKYSNREIDITAIVGAGLFPGVSGWLLYSELKRRGGKQLIEIVIGGKYNFSRGAAIDYVEEIKENAAGGGQGTDIAEKLLLRGIPTLLEHPAHEKEIIKCLKASKNTPFMINPFYRYISPVQDFLEAAKVMNHHSVLLSASLDCAIHVLYDGIDILGCALENFSGWKLGTVAEIVGSTLKSGGNKSIKIMIGDIPVMFVINTDVDKDDPDHPLHLYHRIELTFSTGRLCLVNTHGPVIWMPFQHMPRDEYGTISIDKDNKEIPTAIMLGNSKPLSLKKTVEYIWTGAVVQALECLFSMDKTKKMQMAQYQIFVSRLWSEISRKTGYLNLVNYNNSGNNEEIFDELQKKGLLEEKIFV